MLTNQEDRQLILQHIDDLSYDDSMKVIWWAIANPVKIQVFIDKIKDGFDVRAAFTYTNKLK